MQGEGLHLDQQSHPGSAVCISNTRAYRCPRESYFLRQPQVSVEIVKVLMLVRWILRIERV